MPRGKSLVFFSYQEGDLGETDPQNTQSARKMKNPTDVPSRRTQRFGRRGAEERKIRQETLGRKLRESKRTIDTA